MRRLLFSLLVGVAFAAEPADLDACIAASEALRREAERLAQAHREAEARLAEQMAAQREELESDLATALRAADERQAEKRNASEERRALDRRASRGERLEAAPRRRSARSCWRAATGMRSCCVQDFPTLLAYCVLALHHMSS